MPSLYPDADSIEQEPTWPAAISEVDANAIARRASPAAIVVARAQVRQLRQRIVRELDDLTTGGESRRQGPVTSRCERLTEVLPSTLAQPA